MHLLFIFANNSGRTSQIVSPLAVFSCELVAAFLRGAIPLRNWFTAFQGVLLHYLTPVSSITKCKVFGRDRPFLQNSCMVR